jgi:hypothetical protein
MIRFGLIGYGYAGKRHVKAIESIGGCLKWVCDPIIDKLEILPTGVMVHCRNPLGVMLNSVDYVVIASPSYLHREHIRTVLKAGPAKIICEKPMCLPWEPLIDDNRINIVMQLRWIPDLPKKADLVRAVMVRDEAFFKSWKGDPKLAGGNLYEFFVHYCDLAVLLGADFEGIVLPEGKQEREIVWDEPTGREKDGWIECGLKKLDIMQNDQQDLYNRMYQSIIASQGVKPKDIFYLTWILNKYSDIHGYRNAGINEPIKIPKELL